jgi:hypothetical protein
MVKFSRDRIYARDSTILIPQWLTSPLLNTFSRFSLKTVCEGAWVAREGGGESSEGWFFSMAKARSWFVESKEFEMLIKGGNCGLRIVERSKKKNRGLFLYRGMRLYGWWVL